MVKQAQMTRNKVNSQITSSEDAVSKLQLQTRNSERTQDAASSLRRQADILPKLPQANTLDTELTKKLIDAPTSAHGIHSPNSNARTGNSYFSSSKV